MLRQLISKHMNSQHQYCIPVCRTVFWSSFLDMLWLLSHRWSWVTEVTYFDKRYCCFAEDHKEEKQGNREKIWFTFVLHTVHLKCIFLWRLLLHARSTELTMRY